MKNFNVSETLTVDLLVRDQDSQILRFKSKIGVFQIMVLQWF